MVHRNQRLPLVGKNKFLWKKVNKSNPHQLYLIADGLKFRVLISTPVENDDFKTRDFSSLVEWVGPGVNNVHRSNCNQELRICYMYEKSRLHFIKMCQSKILITNPSSNCLKNVHHSSNYRTARQSRSQHCTVLILFWIWISNLSFALGNVHSWFPY